MAEPPDEPTELIKLRLWADGENVEALANNFSNVVTSLGYKLLERSKPYPCRPPQQRESRIYMSFIDDKDV